MRNKILLLSFTVCLILLSGSPLFSEESSPVIRCGDETVSAEEVRYLLSQQAGGNEGIASVILDQMNEEDRNLFLENIVESMLLAKAAQLQGLHLERRVATQIRWNEINLLAQAYVGWASERWDMSDAALKTYYDSHRELFFQDEEAHVRQLLFRTEEDARNACIDLMGGASFDVLAEERSVDPVSSRNGGDLGWIRRHSMPRNIDEVIFSLAEGSVSKPVRSEYGYHVFQVLECRKRRLLEFTECRDSIREALGRSYISKDLKQLRERLKPVVSTEALGAGTK